MAKVKVTAKIAAQEQLADGIYSMRIEVPQIASQAAAGQFVDLYSKDGSRLLPRPISLCGVDRENGTLRLVYRVAGAGTEEFSHLKAGDTIDVLGPLGNGFTLREGKKAFLIGGGIGIGIATGKATEAISRQPEASGKIQTNLLLGAALAEGTAIFGFVVALLIILFLG